MYECPLATLQWNTVQDVINQTLHFPLLDPNNYVINSDNVMFNYPPDATSQLQEDVIDIIMIMKHVLYRLKFRENRNVFPSPRMATVIAALELEKIIKVQNYMNKDAPFITNFTKNLKTRAGIYIKTN